MYSTPDVDLLGRKPEVTVPTVVFKLAILFSFSLYFLVLCFDKASSFCTGLSNGCRKKYILHNKLVGGGVVF